MDTTQKLPYNCWHDYRRGFVLPKCPVIKNTPEVIEWLRNNVMKLFRNYGIPGDESNGIYHINDEWLCIGIGCAWSGVIYCSYSSETPEFFEKAH